MQRLASSGKAESFCVDGDIKRVAGNITEAVLAYLNGHIVDSDYTKLHLELLTPDQKDEVTAVLQEWLKTDEDSRSSRKKQGVKATPDQIWNFIFNLQPEAVTTCFGRIDPLMNEKRYQQAIDSCSAILHHYPNDTAPILLKRALAYTLIGNHEKQAIADYLRAFIKDKDATIQVTRSKQGQHLPKITVILKNCVYSPRPNSSLESKQTKQWLHLTIDCCRLLITLDPNNFHLQMTYAERLTQSQTIDKAIAVLNECLGVLKLDLQPDPQKLTEAWLRRGFCYLLKHQTDMATMDITAGLNAISDNIISMHSKTGTDFSEAKPVDDSIEYDVTMTFLQDNKQIKFTEQLAQRIFAEESSDLSQIFTLLDKAAVKLNPPDKYGGVMKLDNVRQASDLYRAILVIKSKHRDTLVKLSLCYSKLGRHNYAIKIYDFLLSDKKYSQDNTILSARAACYRELGNKVEARKDYDVLLQGNPQDPSLLFERALVHMENNDINSLVNDLQIACKANQRTVTICMNKLPLAQRTRIRQILFEHAKALLQDAHMPDIGDKSSIDSSATSAGSMALSIAQLLTKLNFADHPAHIIKAHAMYFVGSFNDSELCLKKLLQENPQNPDAYMIKLHLGLLRIFNRHTDEGMTLLVGVLTSKGERTVSSLLRDIPVSERARLSDECHQYAIDILQKRRDPDVVRQAAHCFTIAILCCRGTDLILEGDSMSKILLEVLTNSECLMGIRKKSEKMTTSAWSLAKVKEYSDFKPPIPSIFSSPLQTKYLFDLKRVFLTKAKSRRLNGGTGVCRSYLARAECMAHLGDQRSAVLDFSAALEVNPGCVEGLCGRAFMRLALGDENDCVEDIISACELDTYTVTAHIKALPEEAKKLLLFWLDHRVVALLLNYGYRAGSRERISTGGSASTISVMDETALKPGHESSRDSSLSSIQPPSPTESEKGKVKGPKEAVGNKIDVESANGSVPQQNDNPGNEKTTTTGMTGTPIVADVHKNPVSGDPEKDTAKQQQDVNVSQTTPLTDPTKRKLHKSSASRRNFKDALLTIEKTEDANDNITNEDGTIRMKVASPTAHDSRESTAMTTNSSLFTYDDVINGMEKAEILHRAQLLGKLLITVDPLNSSWHGMYADILIVKGDFDEALRHLQIVMKLTPSDVTGIARAGLINVKQNRYKLAASLLSVLSEIDKNGLVYVLRALDSQKRSRLSEEALRQAEELCVGEKYNKAIEYYGLSLCADDGKRVEKLRMRARCFTRLRDMKRALEDMTVVMKETAKAPKAGDYCIRAHILLLDNKEQEACQDYIKALKLDRDHASVQIHAKPGRGTLAKVFYRQALDEFSHHSYQECSDMCDYGLMIDEGNTDLRKLRARAKREIKNCIIQ